MSHVQAIEKATEVLYNLDFKRIEFDTFKEDAGTNAFVFSIEDWSE